MKVEEAYAQCTEMARTHYENFPVGRFVPKPLQHHVHAVYAFARHADDLADEGYDRTQPDGSPLLTEQARLDALNDWERQLTAPQTAKTHPIFIALHQTIKDLDLPLSLFTDLISAFKQDVVKRRYADFPEVLDYCRRSANPIGRLVLLLHGERDSRRHELSDHICTALQLANFWQDVAVDLGKDRIYLPVDDQKKFGVSEADLFAHNASDAYRRLLRFQVDRTQELFNRGEPLSRLLPGTLGWEIRLTWLGGTTILRKIEDQHYDTLSQRPKLAKRDFLSLLGQAWLNP
jgi:squalene synthase HpnC